jgi:phage N-6-adenine-methyltransferase
MKGQNILFSSKSDEWRTPYKIVTLIKDEGFNIALDLAATEENAIAHYFCDDLFNDDQYDKELVFEKNDVAYCNPPYSKCKEFVKKVSEIDIPVIMLLPARTDTKWFHDYIYMKEDVKIKLIKGRLKFSDAKSSAPFPSMLVYFRCHQ